jgi:GT2 family glycosyltransferase
LSRVAVVTLNKGRRSHLLRLLEGLAHGTPPARCTVVEMGDDTEPRPVAPFPIERVVIDAGSLPLSAARNAGAAAATGEHLVFLDVDCIPSCGLVEGFDRVLAAQDGLVCCAVRYLPSGAVQDGWREADLRAAGQLHPVRSFPEAGVERVDNAGLFWSLAFGIRRSTFERLGGFDAGFTGYGAEDTDFAFRARDAGVPLLFAGGFEAFHQWHPAYDPPLQHFSDIVRNAGRFHERHGIWPMDGWLDAFAERGLIARDRRGGLRVLRPPSPAEIEAARLPDDRPF